MKKRLFVFILILLSAGLSFAAGDKEASVQEPEGPVTITLLIQPEMMWDGFKAVIADWEEKTGNTIDVQNLGGDQLFLVLTSRVNIVDPIVKTATLPFLRGYSRLVQPDPIPHNKPYLESSHSDSDVVL